MFGGNTTTGPEEVNGNAKIIQSFISPEHLKKTKVFSFMYETEPFRSETSPISKEYKEQTLLLFEKTFKLKQTMDFQFIELNIEN